MKILHIVNPVVPFPAKTVGGTERVVQYIIEELVKQGHDVTLMAHNDSAMDGVKVIPIGTYQDQKQTLKKIWKHLLFNRYDVIHNHGRLIYFLPSIWSKTRKIHTFHLAEFAVKTFKKFLKLKPTNLTLSPCAKWIQEKYSTLPGNWQFVNNGIPADKYKFNDHCTVDSPLVIVCRICEGKGVLDAIEIARISNRKLIVAGQGGDQPDEIEWFQNVFLKLCDGEQIKYVGPVNDQQKQYWLERAAALLMVSIDVDAFNLTMLEANACGCPVVSYNRFFPPDFIVEGINGFIGNSQEELVNKIKQLHQIDRNNCRQQFENQFTSKIMTANYLQLYRSKV